jgi:predicted ferric reductase
MSLFQIAFERIGATWPWYVVRGAGFIAVFLLILLMFSGIGLVTGHMYRLFEPAKAWAVHKALAIALCVSVAVHVIFLLFDHYVSFSIPQLLVPFLSHYQRSIAVGPVLGTLAIALGILAMYGIVIVVASSLGWIDTKKALWKKLHFTSYLVMLFVFLHALYTGTDLAYGTFRAVWLLIGSIILLGVVARVWRAGTLSKKIK